MLTKNSKNSNNASAVPSLTQAGLRLILVENSRCCENVIEGYRQNRVYLLIESTLPTGKVTRQGGELKGKAAEHNVLRALHYDEKLGAVWDNTNQVWMLGCDHERAFMTFSEVLA